MEDVARECGVTKKTVSRVFAGGAAVKPSTREKILEAARRLNYEYNTLAQSFSSKRSRFIGVATAFQQLVGTSYFGELFRGIASVLNETEMDLSLFDTDTDSFSDGEKLAKLYRRRRVDGLLVVAPHTYDRFLGTLERLHVPMIVVGVQPAGKDICSVSLDDAKGIRLLCEHLYGLGHRNMAFVAGPDFVTTSEQRKQAYVQFCRDKGLECPAHYIQPGSFSIQTGREAVRRHFADGPRRVPRQRSHACPTAIVAANDLMALGAMDAARELGLRVPEDLSIAGFDNLPVGGELPATLTTIHTPVMEMGRQSAAILVNALQQSRLPAGSTVLDVSLVTRASTAKVRARL